MTTLHANVGGSIRATLPGHAQSKTYHPRPGEHRPVRPAWPAIQLPNRDLVHGDLVPFAYAVAHRAHEGQTDKAGREYIAHPGRMVARLAPNSSNDTVLAVAWLHDVVEDTDISLDDLRLIGFPDEVVRAVDAISRRNREPYFAEYLQRVAANPVALKVKLADIADNSDPARLALLPEDVAAAQTAKHEKALATLADLVPKSKLPSARWRAPSVRASVRSGGAA